MSDVAGQRVLITGGSRGIGRAAALAFHHAGARLALLARHAHTLADAKGALGEEVLTLSADVRDSEQVARAVDRALARWGGIDVLVNSAGVVWAGDFEAQPYESIAAVLDVNLKGLLYVTRAAVPAMLGAGSGVIINLSSGAGLTGFADLAAYSASKFGVVGFTQSLDEAYSGRGLRVYALCPGRVATDMQAQYSGRRVGLAPERVAQRILALAGPRPRARTGECITLG